MRVSVCNCERVFTEQEWRNLVFSLGYVQSAKSVDANTHCCGCTQSGNDDFFLVLYSELEAPNAYLHALINSWLVSDVIGDMGWCGGSTDRASASRSHGFYDPRFEPRQDHKNEFWEFFRVKHVLTHYRCAQSPCVCARIRMITYAR